jgi:hypothetical protein
MKALFLGRLAALLWEQDYQHGWTHGQAALPLPTDASVAFRLGFDAARTSQAPTAAA